MKCEACNLDPATVRVPIRTKTLGATFTAQSEVPSLRDPTPNIKYVEMCQDCYECLQSGWPERLLA